MFHVITNNIFQIFGTLLSMNLSCLHHHVFKDSHYMWLSQSLRARNEQSLVRYEVENTNSNVAIKQVLSFILTEKVGQAALCSF